MSRVSIPRYLSQLFYHLHPFKYKCSLRFMFFYSFVTYLSRIADDFHCFSILVFILLLVIESDMQPVTQMFRSNFLLFHSEKIKIKSCFQFCLSASAFDRKKG